MIKRRSKKSTNRSKVYTCQDLYIVPKTHRTVTHSLPSLSSSFSFYYYYSCHNNEARGIGRKKKHVTCFTQFWYYFFADKDAINTYLLVTFFGFSWVRFSFIIIIISIASKLPVYCCCQNFFFRFRFRGIHWLSLLVSVPETKLHYGDD